MRLFWAILSLFPLPVLGAASASPGIFDLPDTDKSLEYLSSILGTVSGLNVTGDNPVFGMIFQRFNAAVLGLCLVVVLASIFISTMNTAQEGEVMGKKWSTIWVPLRWAFGSCLLIPTASGYSYIQVAIVWLILQGMAAANQVWNTALDYMSTGGSSNVSQVLTQLSNASASNNFRNFYQGMICMAVYNHRLEIEAAVPNPDARYTTKGLEGMPVLLQQDNSDPNYYTYLLTTDRLFTNYLLSDKSDQQLKAASLCGSFKLKKDFRFDANDPPNQVFSDQQNQEILSTYRAAMAGLTDAFITIGEMAVEAQSSPEVWDVDQVRSVMRIIVSNWSILSGAISMSANQDNDPEIQAAREGGWIHAGSFYFKMATAENAQRNSLQGVPTFIEADALSLSRVLGGIGENTTRSITNEITTRVNGTWDFAVKTVDPNATKPRTVMASIGGAGSGALGALGSAFTNAASSFSTMITSKQKDPISSIARVGSEMVAIIEMSWFLGILIFFLASIPMNICRSMNPAGFLMDATIRWVVIFVSSFAMVLWAAAATMAIYIPLIPFVLFLAATMGWMMGAIEAVVAAPLIALGIATPSEDELGKLGQSLMLIVNAFLRPTLTIVGFIAATKIINVAFLMLNFSFGAALQSAVGGVGLFGIVAVVGVYAGLASALCNKGFGLIYQVPDKVLRWIGGPADAMDEGDFLHSAHGSFDKGSQAALGLNKAVAAKMKDGARKPPGGVGGQGNVGGK